MEIKKEIDYVFNVDSYKPLEGTAICFPDGTTKFLSANDTVPVSIIDSYVSDVVAKIRADMAEILKATEK